MTRQTEIILTNKANDTLENFKAQYTNKSTDGYHGQLVEVLFYPIQDITKTNLSPKGTADAVIFTMDGLTKVEMKTNGGDITELLKDYEDGLNYIVIYGMFSGFNKKFKVDTGLKVFNLKDFVEILLKYKAIKPRGSKGGYSIDYRYGFQCEVMRALDYNRMWDFTLCDIEDIDGSVARMKKEYIQRV